MFDWFKTRFRKPEEPDFVLMLRLKKKIFSDAFNITKSINSFLKLAKQHPATFDSKTPIQDRNQAVLKELDVTIKNVRALMTRINLDIQAARSIAAQCRTWRSQFTKRGPFEQLKMKKTLDTYDDAVNEMESCLDLDFGQEHFQHYSPLKEIRKFADELMTRMIELDRAISRAEGARIVLVYEP